MLHSSDFTVFFFFFAKNQPKTRHFCLDFHVRRLSWKDYFIYLFIFYLFITTLFVIINTIKSCNAKRGTTMKMASRLIDLISKKPNFTCSTLFLLISKKQISTCSTLFCLSLAVVFHDYNTVLYD